MADDSHISLAVSHAMLAASSTWSLIQCIDFKFARVAFGLYIVNGIVGFFTYGVSSSSLRLYKTYSMISQCVLLVILPLVATQLYINQGFDYHLALFNLCFPIVHGLVLQLAKVKHSRIPFLELLQCIPLLSITYTSVIHYKYYGLAVVISYVISFYVLGTTGMIYSTPSKELFNISLVFANMFTVNALHATYIDDTTELLSQVHQLCYVLCLPLLAAELNSLDGSAEDSIIYILLPILLYVFFNELTLDGYNAACVYAILLATRSVHGTAVALFYALFYLYVRCIPHSLLTYTSCALCQWLLSALNVLTAVMLHTERKLAFSVHNKK